MYIAMLFTRLWSTYQQRIMTLYIENSYILMVKSTLFRTELTERVAITIIQGKGLFSRMIYD